MRDGRLRRAVKRVARLHFELELRLRRVFRAARGGAPYTLGGECRRCARCCEAPSIRVGRVAWYLPTARRAFLWWQERVNGFVLTDRLPASRVFVFRCTHFDVETRSCDSYESRPGICRDYPRALLDQPRPEMLPGCGYRPVLRGAARMLRVLDENGLTPEQREKLARELHLR
jgi:uncharacterized protein